MIAPADCTEFCKDLIASSKRPGPLAHGRDQADDRIIGLAADLERVFYLPLPAPRRA
jgi:hypothetical protein